MDLDHVVSYHPLGFLEDLGRKARDAGQKGGPFGIGTTEFEEARGVLTIRFSIMQNGLTFGFYGVEKKWGETTYSYLGCSPLYGHQGHCLSLLSRGAGYQSRLFSRNGVSLSPLADCLRLYEQIGQMTLAQHMREIKVNFMFPGQ